MILVIASTMRWVLFYLNVDSWKVFKDTILINNKILANTWVYGYIISIYEDVRYEK